MGVVKKTPNWEGNIFPCPLLLNYEILIIISSEIKACDVSKDQDYLPPFLPEAWPFAVTSKKKRQGSG